MAPVAVPVVERRLGGAARARTASPASSSRCSAPRAASAAPRWRSTWPSPPRPSWARRSSLVDGSFQFGDVGVLLNLNPKNKSIADLVPELEAAARSSRSTRSSSTTRPASASCSRRRRPRWPSSSRRRRSSEVLEALRETHDLVVVDCTSYFNDTTLAILDSADTILTMLTLEITSIKNMRLFLEVADQLGYESGKIRLVLNRADSALGIRVADVEHSIGRKVDHTIVSDGRSVVYALNRGVPFFLSNREAQVSQDVLRLAKSVVGDRPQVAAGDSDSRKAAAEEVVVRMALNVPSTRSKLAPRGEKGCRRCPC